MLDAEDYGAEMTDSTQRPVESADKHIALLLGEIEKEPVPERLLSLARQLQAALVSRSRDDSPSGGTGDATA